MELLDHVCRRLFMTLRGNLQGIYETTHSHASLYTENSKGHAWEHVTRRGRVLRI